MTAFVVTNAPNEYELEKVLESLAKGTGKLAQVLWVPAHAEQSLGRMEQIEARYVVVWEREGHG